VNAALSSEFYFKVAGHNFTVVAADANYVKPYTTDIIAIAPGETVDALVVADAPPGKYYMAALSIQSPEPVRQLPVAISRGIVYYNNSSKGSENTPAMAPEMPHYNDATASLYFHGNLTSLPHPLLHSVPTNVDVQMFITTDMGYICKDGRSSCDRSLLVSRMSNISFQLPTATPLLQAHYYHNVTTSVVQEFPSFAPPNTVFNDGMTVKATSFRRVRYNTTLEIVFQGPTTALSYSNPMHLHGHDFFILAHGLGKYDREKDLQTYNLVDPPMRNIASVPIFGWIAIRFVASNPGKCATICIFMIGMFIKRP
jgi:laccase